MSDYSRFGFRNRIQYLHALIEHIEPDLQGPDNPYTLVIETADLLGPDEDFDGLLSAIADYIGYIPQPEDFCN